MKRASTIALLALACGGPPPEASGPPPVPAPFTQPAALAPAAGAAEAAPSAAESAAPTPVAAPPSAEIRLVVGRGIREVLVPLAKDAYTHDEIEALMTRLRDDGGPFCRYKHGLEPLDKEAVAAFVDPPGRFIQHELGAKWSMIAGCWNFVRMNDRQPYRDFELLRQLFPTPEGYDCYAVGVMQSYIMSEVLACRDLTMIDFDWQIHAVHWQLLRLWEEGKLGADQLDAALAGLRVDWIAYHDPREGHETSLETLCHPGIGERCRGTLAAFQGRRTEAGLRRITLDVAGLHEVELGAPEPGERIKVIFLSNATEKHFLTRPEFDQLLARTEAALLPGQRAIFVHHVAGDSSFGLYELVREEQGSSLSARCRDVYIRGKVAGSKTPYETWFEQELVRRGRGKKKVPTCRSIPVK